MPYVVGIDLGTSNSVVAYFKEREAAVIANAEGGKTTPSVVLFREDEEPIVGEIAKRQQLILPRQTVRSVKRLMGRRLEEVQELTESLPYEITENEKDGEVRLHINGREMLPAEVSAHILAKMKDTAEDFLGETIDQAVITVPAYFNDSQRQATKMAAQDAGLEALRIINEPTAAALAFGLGKDRDGSVAVFDFGGGTFDISILEIEEEVFEVRSTNGDTQLGGDNIDEALCERFLDEIHEQTGIDPREDPTIIQRVREAAEKAKCELSSMTSTSISLPFIVADDSGPKHYNRDIAREEFDSLTEPILSRLLPPCRQALADAGLRQSDINYVVLVGGSTRIPAVQTLVKEFFNREPVKNVNPDEAVAIGAAIQAGIMTGDIEEVLLLDVTPLSLGIEVEGGVFRSLIPRNSSIPVSTSRRFTTTRDNQENVDIHVLQGERPRAAENRSLTHLRLNGIDPAPAEVPEIEVTFSIDADGILSVSAMDPTSGQQNEIVVQSYAAAATREVDTLLEEAKEHQSEDRRFLETAHKRARARTVIRDMESFLEEGGDEVSEEDLKEIKDVMFRLDVALHGDDLEPVNEAEQRLIELGGKYSEVFYMYRLGDRGMSSLGEPDDLQISSEQMESFSNESES